MQTNCNNIPTSHSNIYKIYLHILFIYISLFYKILVCNNQTKCANKIEQYPNNIFKYLYNLLHIIKQNIQNIFKESISILNIMSELCVYFV